VDRYLFVKALPKTLSEQSGLFYNVYDIKRKQEPGGFKISAAAPYYPFFY